MLNAMKTLNAARYTLQVYPTEARSLCAERWQRVHTAAEWRRLGEAPMLTSSSSVTSASSHSDVSLTWHEPSLPELQLAAAVVQEFVLQPLETLLAAGSAPVEVSTCCCSASPICSDVIALQSIVNTVAIT
jgi:hypothetical protein